ncbi:MAG: rod shape-determining protein MreD [Eubacterium sp.]|nr:rod shape-determining protein MreD [Eubacterium sp.]
MRRAIFTGIIVIIFFILQTSVFGMLKLAGIMPNVLVILVSSIAVMRGQKDGMLVGFFCGLLVDMFYGTYLGVFAFLYMIFGFIDGFFHRIYYSDDNFLPLIMIAANDLVYGLLMFVARGLLKNHLHFFYYLRSIILPELVYTIAVGMLLYQILLRANNWMEKYEDGNVDIV